jgi:cytochrome c oxidase assembly factor CtaG
MTPQMLPWIWIFEPAVLLGIAVGLGLYLMGLRYSLATGLARHLPPWRWLCFVAGLLAIFVALESPIDVWAGMYLWAHMVQHILLLYVAAPLLLLGAPLMPVLRAFPLEARRQSLRWVMTHPTPRQIGVSIGRLIGNTRFVWFLFVSDFIFWHLAPVYDAALSYPPLHYLEHICFLGTALLFWSQIIPSAPLKPHLAYPGQIAYLFMMAMVSGFVSLVLVYNNHPIYTYYLHMAHPVGALSASVDQVAAGAIMNITDLSLYGTLILVLLWTWINQALAEDAKSEQAGTPGHDVQPGPVIS